MAANGDTFDFQVQHSHTVREVKGILEAKSGISVGSQQLYVLDDTRQGVEDFALKNNNTVEEVLRYTSSDIELKLAVMADTTLPEWDPEWAGQNLVLSEHDSCARCNSGGEEGMAVRSKMALEPHSGTHCFEYTYSHPDRTGSMGGCYMVGVVLADVPLKTYSTRGYSYGEGGGIFGTKSLWVLEDSGPVWAGISPKDTHGRPGASFSRTKGGQAYEFGDKIGFSIDTDKGKMRFFRNGKLVEGADIENVPIEAPLHLVASPFNSDVSVKLARPSEPYPMEEE
jgi:hypothetical protein